MKVQPRRERRKDIALSGKFLSEGFRRATGDFPRAISEGQFLMAFFRGSA